LPLGQLVDVRRLGADEDLPGAHAQDGGAADALRDARGNWLGAAVAKDERVAGAGDCQVKVVALGQCRHRRAAEQKLGRRVPLVRI